MNIKPLYFVYIIIQIIIAPLNFNAQTTIWSNDFSSASGWILSGSGQSMIPGSQPIPGSSPNVWAINGVGTTIDGTSNLHITCTGLICSLLGAPGPLYNATDGTNNTNTVAYMNSDIPAASFSGPGPFFLQFQWMCMGGTVPSEGGARLLYSTNSGANWIELPFIYNGSNSVNNANINFTSFIGFNPGVTPIRFGFRWFNQIGSGLHQDPPMIVDNMQVIASSGPPANTITTTQISPNSICPGGTVQVNFTSTGTFNAGNIYTAELSNASGSFASPVVIGTLPSTANSGTITCTIPPGTPPGTGYQIRIVSSNPSVTGAPGTVSLTVTSNITPTVTLNTNPQFPVCSGTSVTFTALATGGGSSPTFAWFVNGVLQSTGGTTFTSSSLSNGDLVEVVMNSSDPCASPQTANAGINVSIQSAVSPQVSISPNPGPNICPGETVTFTPIPVNGGSSPTYNWFVNGSQVATGPTYSSFNLQDGDAVTVTMISSLACANPSSVTSGAIVISHTATVSPSVSITANPGVSICAGDNVTFTPNPVHGGTNPTYQWFVNGSPVSTNATYSTSNLQDGDQVSVTMTSSSACANPQSVSSQPLTINVSSGSGQLPTVTVTVNPGTTICAGQTVTFTATVQNGGSNPSFQWQVNGANAGNNQPNFTTSSLMNGDVVTVIVTVPGGNCGGGTATSSPITMNVTSSIIPTVVINSNPTSPICSGTSVTFTATPNNGGSNPTYQWFINGIAQPGNQATFTTSNLNNNDIVTCVMTSSASCAVPATATSNPIQITVTQSVTPSVSITAQPSGPVCPNEQITFTEQQPMEELLRFTLGL